MILLLLSCMDLLCAAMIVWLSLGDPSSFLAIYCAVYLVGKMVVFWQTAVSWFDGLAGIWIILLIVGVHAPWISFLAAGWLTVKSLTALF